MDASTDKKIVQAEQILEREKQELMDILTAFARDELGTPRNFLVFFEEDAKYRIKALKLPKKITQQYLDRICDIYGPYSEDQPDMKRKYYDNDYYVSL